MNSLFRLGGIAGMLAGPMLLLSLLSGIPVYSTAPPEIFSTPLDPYLALGFMSNAAPGQRLAFKALLASQITAHALMIPALLIGATLAMGGILFNFVDALLGLPLTGYFIEHYADASAGERAAMATLLRFVGDLQVLTMGWQLLGAGMIFLGWALPAAAFPRWLAWSALLLGATGMATMLNQFVVFVPSLLSIVWFPLLGINLFRRSAAAGA